MQLTRVRLEAHGDKEVDVRDQLLASAALVRDQEGGTWQEEEPGVEIQTARQGFWGRYTIRRADDSQ